MCKTRACWPRILTGPPLIICVAVSLSSIGLLFAEIEDKSRETQENEDIFIPTKYWKNVKNDQKIPAGLHVRLNLQTGKREAKLLDNENEESSFSEVRPSRSLIEVDSLEMVNTMKGKTDIMRDNIISALRNLKSEDGKPPKELMTENRERKSMFRSYSDLKAEFEELNMNIETDSEIISRLIEKFKTHADDNVKIAIIDDLEYLTHQFDNAINFINMDGIPNVIRPGLNSSNEGIRKGVMRLLGSASQSNPQVQIAALEEGLLSQLLRIIAGERDTSISSKAVHAVSCLVRGFPFGQERLIETGGLHTLREVFQNVDWHSLPLQLKVVSLIQDLIDERSQAEGERAKQLDRIDLAGALVQGDWCPAVASLLKVTSFDEEGKRYDMAAALSKGVPLRSDHDTVDKVVNAMVLLSPYCKEQFDSSLPLLLSLKNIYSDLAYKEQFQQEKGFELFSDVESKLRELIRTVSRRDEL